MLNTVLALLPSFYPNQAALYVAGFTILYSVIATIIIPGAWRAGAELKDKTHIQYKMNGFGVVFGAPIIYILLSNYGPLKLFPASIIYDNYLPLLGTLLLISVAFNTFLFLRAKFFIPKNKINNHGETNLLINYWTGIELNPHFFGFEIKLFSYRPGFILSTLINLSAMIKQYENFGQVSMAMYVFIFVNTWYVADAFVFEHGMCFMFDIIEENFGFMLVFGDFFWIPWVFSVQAPILAVSDAPLTQGWIAFTMLVFVVGFTIFRGSNYQKYQFRLNPKGNIWGRAPRTIQTSQSGKPLLISGWWGIGRKINYLGDILIAFSMAMPCNFSILAYMYPIYLTILLIHRAMRDNERCQEKYKDKWDEYCKKVPYMIVPYVY